MPTPQGCDVPLLWVPRGLVALVGSGLEATLPNAGQLATVVIIVNLRIFMMNFYPRPRHTHDRDRILNLHRIARGSIIRLQVRLALRLQAIPAL